MNSFQALMMLSGNSIANISDTRNAIIARQKLFCEKFKLPIKISHSCHDAIHHFFGFKPDNAGELSTVAVQLISNLNDDLDIHSWIRRKNLTAKFNNINFTMKSSERDIQIFSDAISNPNIIAMAAVLLTPPKKK